MSEPCKIAVAGLGTVGVGLLKLLRDNDDLVASRAGRRIEVVAVSARDRTKDRGVELAACRWFDDAQAMAREADAEILVELIGGSEGVAKATVEAALNAGKHVVTANKALVAHHGAELALLAERHDRCLAYEAAVAGGIPIIKTLREGMAANHISRVYGILNGTCNYILSTMRTSGRDFGDVLSEAQALGYAEADPSFDIDGVDAAHKLAILAALAFGCEVAFDRVHIEGIRGVSAFDIAAADELGYRIKLLGVAAKTDRGIEQRVHPCMVPKGVPIAAVEGVLNAVVADGDFVGSIVAEGPGAGGGPTASAVVADLIDITRGNRLPTFAVGAEALAHDDVLPMGQHRGSYYLRLSVRDQAGVIADVSSALRDHQVSVEAILQRGRDDGEGKPVPVVITTHEATEDAIQSALAKIADLDAVLEPPGLIRIETL